MNKPLLLAAALGLVFTAACGDDDAVGENPGSSSGGSSSGGDVPLEMPEPCVGGFSPGTVVVGDTLTVFGEGFVEPPIGTTELEIFGTFTTLDGNVLDVNYTVVPSFRRASMLTFQVSGALPPNGFGHDMGTLDATVRAKNVSVDGETTIAGLCTTTIKVEMEPSLVFDEVRPEGQGCDPQTKATIENQNLRIVTRAIGIGEADSIAPITYTYLFMQPTADISLADAFAFSENVEVAKGGLDQDGVVVLVDRVTAGTASTLDPNWFSQFYEGGISTWAVPAEGQSYILSVYVEATNAEGDSVSGTYELRVNRSLEVSYDGNSRPVRTFDPVAVSGCLSGGPRGVNVSYSENSSESRSRSFSVGAGIDVGVGIRDVVKVGFGFDVGTSVSSSQSVGESLSLSGHILPGEYGVFYRQTTQLARVGEVVSYGACGQSRRLGDVVVTDWAWSPDIAFSESGRCPPLPASNLPPGRVFDEELAVDE